MTTGVVPSATLQSKDGKYVIIGGNGDSVYSRLMAAVGRPDMSSANPLYATNTHRCQRADEIYKVWSICLKVNIHYFSLCCFEGGFKTRFCMDVDPATLMLQV